MASSMICLSCSEWVDRFRIHVIYLWVILSTVAFTVLKPSCYFWRSKCDILTKFILFVEIMNRDRLHRLGVAVVIHFNVNFWNYSSLGVPMKKIFKFFSRHWAPRLE